MSTKSVKEVLEARGFCSDHFEAISEAVATGYGTLRKILCETPMFSKFGPGLSNSGNLRNIAVEYALECAAAETELFHTEFRWNEARNHLHLRLSAAGIILTSHYCGRNGSSPIRKAVNRCELAQRNGDLFKGESSQPDIGLPTEVAYVQIAHSGNFKPEFAALMIPNRDQQSYTLEALTLSLPEPEDKKVEQIENNLQNQFNLIAGQEHENGEQVSVGASKAG